MVLGSAYGGCGVERKGLKPSQVNPGARRPPFRFKKMGENAKPGRKESSGTWFKLNPTRGEIGARLQGTSTVHPPFSADIVFDDAWPAGLNPTRHFGCSLIYFYFLRPHGGGRYSNYEGVHGSWLTAPALLRRRCK